MTDTSGDRIALVDPDPAWPVRYEAEAAALRAAIGQVPGMRLEHFGSTAVPGIRAKPIIDILVAHPDPAQWPALIEPLKSLGYVYWAESPRKDRMFFVKGMPPFGERRTHHVHVRTPADGEAELVFRDRLRADSGAAKAYEKLKEDLAARFPDDRDAYTDGKAEFVARLLGSPASRSPLWLTQAAMVAVFLSVALCLSVVVLRPFLPGSQLTSYVIVPLFWTCGAMAAIGVAGAAIGRQARWLWLLPAAALLDAIFGAP